MPQPKFKVFVNGKAYVVTVCGDIFKAALNGYYGWTAVWADSEINLVRRIKQVRSGGQ